MTPDHLSAELSQGLANLPGRAAQRAMAPELGYGRHHGPPAGNARYAAVLAVLYQRAGQWYLPLTVRPLNLPDHPGQVCFPGGVLEGEESFEQGAVREYEEEVGAPANELQLIGRLTQLYVFASNFIVQPVIAIANALPHFSPNPAEVERMIEFPLTRLCDPAARGTHEIERHGVRFRAPHFSIGSDHVWGATSLIMAELSVILDRVEPALP